MSITIPLEKMTIEEKIQAMESIWNDLCSQTEQLSSPSWHGAVLDEREAAIKSGDDKFEDWETTKQHISKTIR